MKSILNVVIFLILAVLAVKLFIWFIPVLIVIIIVIWAYSKYKINKFKKNLQSEDVFKYKSEDTEKVNVKEKIDEEDKFNGTVIDVDYEDINRE